MKQYLLWLACLASLVGAAPASTDRDAVIAFRQFFGAIAPLAAQDFSTVLGGRDAFGNYNITLALDKKTVDRCYVARDPYWLLTCDAIGYGPERVGQLEEDIADALPDGFKRVKDVAGAASWVGPSGVTVMLLRPEAANDWMAIDIEHIAK